MRISDWSSDVCSSDLLPPRSPSQKAVSAALSDTEGKRPDGTDEKTGSAHARLPVPAVASERHEPCDVFRCELHSHGCPQLIDAEAAQISIEVIALGR